MDQNIYESTLIPNWVQIKSNCNPKRSRHHDAETSQSRGNWGLGRPGWRGGWWWWCVNNIIIAQSQVFGSEKKGSAVYNPSAKSNHSKQNGNEAKQPSDVLSTR